MIRSLHIPACLSMILIMSGIAAAVDISVPDDFKRIQEAVDKASDGDVVIVGPGEWFEAVDLKGKAITLRSKVGPKATTLDGTELGESVLRCLNGEGPKTVVDGFTITGGTGHETLYGKRSAVGGGLIVVATSPTIRNCIFRDNTVTYNGGGVYLAKGATATFEGCQFEQNKAEKGGAVYSVQSNATFVGCQFTNNEARYSGGGMYNADDSLSIVTNCIFKRNRASYYGGAIYEYGSCSTIKNCQFDRNRATYKGGAVYNGFRSKSSLETCKFMTTYDDVYGIKDFVATVVAPTGGCVLQGGSCLHVSRQSCEDAEGSYLGDGTSCDTSRDVQLTHGSDLNNDGKIDDRDALMLLLLWR